MREKQFGPVLAIVCALAMTTSAVHAQDVASASFDEEDLAIQVEAREVTGLYVAGISLLATATLMGVLGGLTSTSGDSIGFGIFPLAASPAPGAFGIALLPIAAGYDVGVRTWRSARGRSEREIAAARMDLSDRITWTYAIGIGVFVLSMGAIVVMYGIDQGLPSGQRLQAGHYLVPAGVSLLGIATIFAGAGMDIAAGAWSGFTPSISPLPGGGAMATGTGTF